VAALAFGFVGVGGVGGSDGGSGRKRRHEKEDSKDRAAHYLFVLRLFWIVFCCEGLKVMILEHPKGSPAPKVVGLLSKLQWRELLFILCTKLCSHSV
jgi:hypothetical protein